MLLNLEIGPDSIGQSQGGATLSWPPVMEIEFFRKLYLVRLGLGNLFDDN